MQYKKAVRISDQKCKLTGAHTERTLRTHTVCSPSADPLLSVLFANSRFNVVSPIAVS